MTQRLPRTVQLHRLVDTEWLDPWGNRLPAKQLADAAFVVVDSTRPANNGYENYDADEGHDAAGRVFWKPRTVDYHGSSAWILDDVDVDRRGWTERIPAHTRLIDVDGTPIITPG